MCAPPTHLPRLAAVDQVDLALQDLPVRTQAVGSAVTLDKAGGSSLPDYRTGTGFGGSQRYAYVPSAEVVCPHCDQWIST
jgi:hypothetical protein